MPNIERQILCRGTVGNTHHRYHATPPGHFKSPAELNRDIRIRNSLSSACPGYRCQIRNNCGAMQDLVEYGRRNFDHTRFVLRSEERRVGKECVSMCIYRWAAFHSRKNTSHQENRSMCDHT